nr:unnamed protein product [Spirometra erinaceieuropaei]
MADARLLEELEKFATRPDILIMGDFNAPHIDWSSAHANSSEQTFDRSFLNTAPNSETGFNPSALQSFEDTPIIETVQFTEGMVLTELLRLEESKSPGPDDIPAKILKERAGELAKPLSMLFHTSFETGYLPPDWKSA